MVIDMSFLSVERDVGTEAQLIYVAGGINETPVVESTIITTGMAIGDTNPQAETWVITN